MEEMTTRCHVVIRRDEWATLQAATGVTSDAQLAGKLGLSRWSVTRVLNGTADPGNQFIARTLQAFPKASFDKLFAVKATS